MSVLLMRLPIAHLASAYMQSENEESIHMASRYAIAMIFTGQRYFRH